MAVSGSQRLNAFDRRNDRLPLRQMSLGPEHFPSPLTDVNLRHRSSRTPEQSALAVGRGFRPPSSPPTRHRPAGIHTGVSASDRFARYKHVDQTSREAMNALPRVAAASGARSDMDADEELAARGATDREAFAELYRRHREAVFRYPTTPIACKREGSLNSRSD